MKSPKGIFKELEREFDIVELKAVDQRKINTLDLHPTVLRLLRTLLIGPLYG